MRARTELVARCDCFDYGDWASWAAAHPPPVAGQALLALSPHAPEFCALAAFVGLCGDDLPAAVSMVRHWLLSGALPAQGVDEVRRSDAAAAAAWAGGLIRASTVCGGSVAHVISDYPGAITLGYRLAPVVVAETAAGGTRKITIAQFERGHLDMAALTLRLNAIEPGWGGSATILGSPQSAAATLEIGLVMRAIEEIGVTI
jgi:hypothetical protein